MEDANKLHHYENQYGDSPPTRKTLAYLDDMDAEDTDVVSELTMNQFPRASRFNNANTARRSSILNLPTRQLRGPTIYGWLWKKGSGFKTWKKRFFLLNGATLTYYTQACVVDTEVGTRCFEMPAKGGLRVAAAEITDLTQFGLRVTSSSGRVLYLQAGDRAARIKWLGVLQEASKKTSSSVSEGMIRTTRVSDASPFRSSSAPPAYTPYVDTGGSDVSLHSSSMSSTLSSDDGDDAIGPIDIKGWLHVRRRTPSMLNLFKKRFVTLIDGRVTLTKHSREPRPRDKSYEILSATSWQGHEYGLKLQLEQHRELLVYANSSDEVKRWLQAIHNNL